VSASTFSAVRDHAIRQIEAAPVRREPFDHVYVENVFPADFYDELLRQLPPTESFRRLNETGRVSAAYSGSRFCLFRDDLPALAEAPRRAFWEGLLGALVKRPFNELWLRVFRDAVQRQAASLRPGEPVLAQSEAFLMRDLESYALGPHTDSTLKLVSVLFYLPADDSAPELGTSLYRPKDPGFDCAGGPHHSFAKFERVTTLPFHRNSLLAFPKSRRCFHGVEPVGTARRRDLMLYDLRTAKPRPLPERAA